VAVYLSGNLICSVLYTGYAGPARTVSPESAPSPGASTDIASMIPTVIIGFNAPPNLPDSKPFTTGPKHFIYPIDTFLAAGCPKIMQSRLAPAAASKSPPNFL
jgi:hypothetical protein